MKPLVKAMVGLTNTLGKPLPHTPQLSAAGIFQHASIPAALNLEPALTALTDSLWTQAQLTTMGRIAARQHLLELSQHLVQITQAREQHTQIGQRRIEAPIFITGLPRTGSTILHYLLAQDPQHRAPLTWEVMRPPLAGSMTPAQIKQHKAYCARRLAWTYRLAPKFAAIHPMAPELPQECIAIMAHALRSIEFHTTNDVPDYQDWLDQQGYGPGYRFQRYFLQHLQTRDCRWIMKAPGHLFSLDALVDEFPDAVVIQTHRDPVRVAGSLASHATVIRAPFTHHVDLAAVAGDWLERWWQALDRATQVRAQAAGVQFVDVHYHDVMADPIAAIASLYERLGWQLTDETRQRFRRFLAQNPQGKHGRHHYRLEDFALSQTQIRDRTQAYMQTYKVREEPLVSP